MDVIADLAAGLVNYTDYTLPIGLKQSESCLVCEYGGQGLTVNFCKRPPDQKCRKVDNMVRSCYKQGAC